MDRIITRMTKMGISDIVKMDIEALYSAFSKEDFKKANMFANRIMSNAIISEDPRFAVIGFFLKDVALIYLEIKAKKETSMFSTAKSFGEVYIKKINLEGKLEDFWKEYHELCLSIRKYLQDESLLNTAYENPQILARKLQAFRKSLTNPQYHVREDSFVYGDDVLT